MELNVSGAAVGIGFLPGEDISLKVERTFSSTHDIGVSEYGSYIVSGGSSPKSTAGSDCGATAMMLEYFSEELTRAGTVAGPVVSFAELPVSRYPANPDRLMPARRILATSLFAPLGQNLLAEVENPMTESLFPLDFEAHISFDTAWELSIHILRSTYSTVGMWPL